MPYKRCYFVEKSLLKLVWSLSSKGKCRLSCWLPSFRRAGLSRGLGLGSVWGRQPREQQRAGPKPRASWEPGLPPGGWGMRVKREVLHRAGSSSSGCAPAPGTPHRLPGIVACDLGAVEVPFLPQDGLRIIVYNCVSINMCVPFDPKSLCFFVLILKDIKTHLWTLRSTRGSRHCVCSAAWGSHLQPRQGTSWRWGPQN